MKDALTFVVCYHLMVSAEHMIPASFLVFLNPEIIARLEILIELGNRSLSCIINNASISDQLQII